MLNILTSLMVDAQYADYNTCKENYPCKTYDPNPVIFLAGIIDSCFRIFCSFYKVRHSCCSINILKLMFQLFLKEMPFKITLNLSKGQIFLYT